MKQKRTNLVRTLPKPLDVGQGGGVISCIIFKTNNKHVNSQKIQEIFRLTGITGDKNGG